jgi:hypothetical protein
MNRLVFLPLAVTALAALALADEPASTPVTEGRIRQLERNQKLLHKLVQGGVSLAKADDRLQRAQYCNDMVNSLADEIKQAAKDHDGDRALELGQHLHDLLERGVAGNLSKESRQVPGGSARMKDLKKLQNQVTKTIRELETDLQNAAAADPENMQPALEAVQHGQVALSDVIQIKARLRNDEGQAK